MARATFMWSAKCYAANKPVSAPACRRGATWSHCSEREGMSVKKEKPKFDWLGLLDRLTAMLKEVNVLLGHCSWIAWLVIWVVIA